MERRTVKQNGGKRAGAGRKKARHTLAAEKAREYLVMGIAKNLKPLIAAQLDSAIGLSYIGKQGRIYTQLPNTKVGEYLLNQIVGRAAVNVEMATSNDERPFIIRLDN